jgi:hypothetical protein
MWHLLLKDRSGVLHKVDERFATPGLALSHAYTIMHMDKIYRITITHVDETAFKKDKVHWESARTELLAN